MKSNNCITFKIYYDNDYVSLMLYGTGEVLQRDAIKKVRVGMLHTGRCWFEYPLFGTGL